MRLMVVLLVVGAACSSEPDKKTQIRQRVKAFADELCKCQTYGCARDKMLEMSRFVRENYPIAKPSKETEERTAKCFDRVAPPDQKSGAELAVKMESFAMTMCDCRDAKCAAATFKKMMAWFKKTFKGDKRKGSKANVARWKAAQQRVDKCYAAAMKAKAPAPVD